MRQTTPQSDIWRLTKGQPWIDSAALLAAMADEARHPPHDFRTRLLLRDSFFALVDRWGKQQLVSRLAPDVLPFIEQIIAEDLGRPGFPSLGERLVEPTEPATILQFLRDLGASIGQPARLDIGGSSSLILAGLLRRTTDDLDAVDEVPSVIRSDHDLLRSLTMRYGLQLAHFQSHYLPTGWAKRVHSIGRFGQLDAFRIDEYDICVGKLFSKRDKDRNDLRVLIGALDRSQIERRFKSSAEKLLGEPSLRENAERNWYVLFGEALPAIE